MGRLSRHRVAALRGVYSCRIIYMCIYIDAIKILRRLVDFRVVYTRYIDKVVPRGNEEVYSVLEKGLELDAIECMRAHYSRFLLTRLRKERDR